MTTLSTAVQEYYIDEGDVAFIAESCFYCGSIATTIDHVPPRSTRKMFDHSNVPSPYRNYEVPCCHECNSGLGDRLCTLKERKVYIAQWLSRRYKRILTMPEWTEEELFEMSYAMQDKIRNSMRIREQVRLRIDHARKGIVGLSAMLKTPSLGHSGIGGKSYKEAADIREQLSEKVLELHASGLTIGEIVTQMGSSYHTIKRTLNERGITGNNNFSTRQRLESADRKQRLTPKLLELKKSGMKVKDIALKAEASEALVYQLLREHAAEQASL